ncbi:glutamate--tRNA ligase [Nocardioides sp.]|uniref:glutamate--tRNA ligase n=1 Tax=Nocardioides sp. TaxID=35761 RepID=UPI0026368E98|nr:glutamate--tRNA ligase [Nocardioides sp.]MCW2738539.1 glutamate--tRNA ligase [Nocardioides sp.]
MSSPVRVRFCPSPTGSPHVGLVRTALFNWAFARHHGGSIIFRMEDTDKERSTQESYDAILELWHWLGLDWDEGIVVGGPHGPYKQSERGDIYADVLARLRESSYTYDCYCRNDEVEARRKASGSKMQGYDGFCRDLSAEQVAAFEAEGRAPIVRFRMPDGSITWDDAVRGDITFETENVPDFALSRANGDPLYTLVNPIDDALMEITHVLRGEDLLSSTPRQLALFEALVELGIARAVPTYGHLPYVMGQGNKKLSKRDPEAHALAYREQGFLPEGLLNYLALLGWAIAADRDIFSLAEMVEAFDIKDVNPNPARFDLKKAEAINAAHMRLLSVDDMTHRVLPFLKAAGVVGDPVSDLDARMLELAMPLVAERINKLTEAPAMLGFLFVDEADFTRDEADVATLLDETGRGVVQAAYDALEGLHGWSAADIEEALRVALIDGMGLKPRVAFGPVRVAVTGARISPPLFESMELLGRDRSLSRLRSAVHVEPA